MYTFIDVNTLYSNPNPNASPSTNRNASANIMYCGGEKGGNGNSIYMRETGRGGGVRVIGLGPGLGFVFGCGLVLRWTFWGLLWCD